MARIKKKRTKVEKEERAKLLNELMGKMMLSSSSVSSNIIQSLHQNTNFGENDFGEDIELDFKAATETMKNISDKVSSGDLSNLEEMLTCQAYSLQTLYMTMASKISGTTNPDHIDLFARFALKAQNQCRSTVATLSEMKNPKRATFIKQQNNAVNQQINQDENSKNLDKPANELLEKTNGERLDTGATSKTISNDDAIAALDEINRTKN